MAAYEVLLLNTAVPQIQAAQSGDTYVVPRDIAFSTVASFAAGAVATPSIVATGDANTGIWFPAADTVAVSTGGIERARISSDGTFRVKGAGLTAGSDDAFQVAGTAPPNAARIDSVGRLLLGTSAVTTSSAQAGEVYSDDAVGFLFTNTTAANYPLSLKNEGTTGTRNFINFYEGTGGGTARANISFDSSNNFVITPANALVFGASSAERARITSGGYFKASNTGTYAGITDSYHELHTAASGDWVGYFTQTTASNPNGIVIQYTGAAPNGAGNTFLYCQDSTALRMSIRSNGGIANYSANNVNLSDRREKTNFAPAGSYLDKICAIPVQTFNYIDQSANDPGLTLGVVAQDVQAVAPELVMESNWGTKEDPKMRLSIYQTDLQYALMKALQELKAEFDAYKATHP